MNIEKIIRAWKADEDNWEAPASPVGAELSEEDLLEISGGDNCVISNCTQTCSDTCGSTCGQTVNTGGGGCTFFTL